jgi:hypothetical protein
MTVYYGVESVGCAEISDQCVHKSFALTRYVIFSNFTSPGILLASGMVSFSAKPASGLPLHRVIPRV